MESAPEGDIEIEKSEFDGPVRDVLTALFVRVSVEPRGEFRAFGAGIEDDAAGAQGGSLGRTLAIAAAFTWLNPHVYLDTLGLIGAVSTGFAPGAERLAFGLGATAASFVFFFALAYGARLLAPVMRSPAAWRWLDAGIGGTMLAIAAKLVLGVL